MPIQSPPRKVTETENMLRLLWCVDALDSATAAQLWTFSAELELMDYVSMRLCLHKLLAAGELETGAGSLRDDLFLTDRGREALALFGERLPADVRAGITKAAPAFRNRLAHNRHVHAAYEIARPNEFRLNLSVCEGDLPTVFLQMQTSNRTLASKALRRFELHAAQITTYLYGLAERALQNATALPETSLPADAVQEHSATEVTARVRLVGKKAQFTAELLLPSRRTAAAFALALSEPADGCAAANRLTEMLSEPLKPSRRKM